MKHILREILQCQYDLDFAIPLKRLTIFSNPHCLKYFSVNSSVLRPKIFGSKLTRIPNNNIVIAF